MLARLTSTLFLLLALLAALPCLAAEAIPTENLDTLIQAALSGNPELRASASRWEMFKSRVKLAGTLDDPMLMLKIQNGIFTDPVNFTRDSMTQKVIGITQQIPYFGKRALREEIAAREADAQHFTHEERTLELTRMVKEAYYQIGSTDHEMHLLDKNIEIIEAFITLAQTKYSVGQGAQQDIFKAQLERSKMLDMRISLEQQRKSLAIGLNALLYRPANTAVGHVPDFGIGETLPDPEQLLSMAEQNSPALKGLRSQLLKGTSSYALAQKEKYPDFNVSFEYMQRQPAMGGDGADMYSLGVTFNLPRKERREAMLAESSSEINMAAEELNGTMNSIASRIADLLAQMERRSKLAELYKSGIIPQAEQSLESATIGYRVGKVDFLTLLDNRVTLFNYEHMYFDSLTDYQVKKAQLEALIGVNLEKTEPPKGGTPAKVELPASHGGHAESHTPSPPRPSP
jgi:outer membrane protein, heavy metal efflux system